MAGAIGSVPADVIGTVGGEEMAVTGGTLEQEGKALPLFTLPVTNLLILLFAPIETQKK